jgi:hypothetical protein
MQNSKVENDALQSKITMPTWPKYSWWHEDAINYNVKMTRQVLAITLFVMVLILIIIILSSVIDSSFKNKSNDPYGQGIRFLQSRDDTGSSNMSLGERQHTPIVSQLTSTPEAPNFSEYYGIDASLKNGSVMIERENFENMPITISDLEKANKGL